MAAINPGEVVKEHQNVLLPVLGVVALIVLLGYYLTGWIKLGEGGGILGPEDKEIYDEYPEMDLEGDLDYRAIIETSMGDIEIDLFEDDAPLAVNNFRFLAENGFYDGLILHRVINGFMIQGGDPNGDGTGGPGYTFADELDNGHDYEPGIIAMANSGEDTNGSQFFITVSTFEKSILTSQHTVFGKVTDGMDVVDAISKVDTDSSDKPVKDVEIDGVYVNAYLRD